MGICADATSGARSERRIEARKGVMGFDSEGWGHADIAAALNVPEGTVRSYVFHARRAMRKTLGTLAEGMK